MSNPTLPRTKYKSMSAQILRRAVASRAGNGAIVARQMLGLSSRCQLVTTRCHRAFALHFSMRPACNTGDRRAGTPTSQAKLRTHGP